VVFLIQLAFAVFSGGWHAVWSLLTLSSFADGRGVFQGNVSNPFVDNKYFLLILLFFFRTKDSQRLVGALALPFDSLKKQRKQRLSAGCDCSCWHPVNEFIIFIVL
jgi:hypothetical protein